MKRIHSLIAGFLLLIVSVPGFAQTQPAASALNAESIDAYQFLQARLASSEGDYGTAIDILGKLIEKDPTDATLRYERASVYLSMRQPEKAEVDLQKAISLEPKFYDAQKLLGRLEIDRSGGGTETRSPRLSSTFRLHSRSSRMISAAA